MVSHSAREVERLTKEEAQGPNPIKRIPPKHEWYDWTDKATGKVHRVPKGIDPGWDYNPGESAWGRRISKEAMDAWRSQGAKAWERLTPGNWETAGRPELITTDRPKAKPGKRLAGAAEMETALEKILGGEERVFSFQEASFRHDIVVNAKSLAEHVDPDRSAFLPFLTEAMEDPLEVWLSFERHKGSGRVALRQRLIKAIRLGKGRGLLVVAQSKGGVMEAWTMIPTTDFKYLNDQREGKLIWAR